MRASIVPWCWWCSFCRPKFTGRTDSLSPASSAQFALLPPTMRQKLQAARELGWALGRAGILVYGGTTKDLMGAIADAVFASKGTVHGVITENLDQRETAPSLGSRKERMMALSDAFIALPGGIGTIKE